jgi:hypothetical protein
MKAYQGHPDNQSHRRRFRVSVAVAAFALAGCNYNQGLISRRARPPRSSPATTSRPSHSNLGGSLFSLTRPGISSVAAPNPTNSLTLATRTTILTIPPAMHRTKPGAAAAAIERARGIVVAQCATFTA